MQRQKNIAVIGLGYVGLPIATAFAKYFPVVGFDVDEARVSELIDGYDRTGELSTEVLNALTQLTLSSNPNDIAQCDFYIVTVPTPVDESNQPDFSPLISASNTVGQFLEADDIVVFESTVYPGATEEICVPVLESVSGLKFNADFFVGYSPERINPGDKTRGLTDIVKVTSGSTPEAAKTIDDIYAKVITAGTHLAPSLAVAEAAKVIENVQRDVNIALVNELATLFAELGLDTLEVLEAAGTKWNFLPFKPGLVGGHCIGVDPYYLIRKAQSVGHNPELIRASRRINNAMGAYVADRVIRLMMQNDVAVNNAKV
ncbi:MAG: nucleotide sugar dehydrogenase, partial [Gammaproteobacteria bacterium]|nr:nucleotide sugar dehydrogenase [Gammaproteobacteria bacterium]